MIHWKRVLTAGWVLATHLTAAAFAVDPPGDSSLRLNPPERLSPTTDYTAERSNPVTHDVDFRAIVTPPYHCRQLRVWMPIPQTDAAQEVLRSQLSTFPVQVEPRIGAEPVYGNKFAYFEFDHPEGAQIIQHQFQVKVWDLNWQVEPTQVHDVTEWPKSFAPCLRPEPIHQNVEFQGILSEIAPQTGNAATDMRRVIDWVDKSLTYDHIHASLQADANHAFEQRRGHCSDYHGLCATMGRMLGYPTRVTYGLSLFPKNSPSHCKLEAFLPPYGWVSYDVSETQKLIDKITKNQDLTTKQKAAFTAAARDRLHRGFRENSWLLLTRGTDYELVPPTSRPVRIVRTIYAEADSLPLPEPDPANSEQHEFSWMTAHSYRSDVPFKQPFDDLTTLPSSVPPAN